MPAGSARAGDNFASRDAKTGASLSRILSVSERTVREWLSRVDKDAKEARDRRIFEMWLACYTQEEIAEAVGCSQGEVAKSIPNGELAEQNKPASAHLTDFDPPLYNVWKQQTRTPGSSHFGNSETRWHDCTSQRWEVQIRSQRPHRRTGAGTG